MSTRQSNPLITGIGLHPEHPCATPDLEVDDASPIAGVWVNLQALAQQWSATTTPLVPDLPTPPQVAWAFQGIGLGFLALSHEESAFAHYQLVTNRLRYPPPVIAEGLEQALTELHEAYVQWVAVGYWFERLANEVSRVPDLLELIRTAIHLVRSQHHRVWALLFAIGEEHVQVQHHAQRWKQEQGWHLQAPHAKEGQL